MGAAPGDAKAKAADEGPAAPVRTRPAGLGADSPTRTVGAAPQATPDGGKAKGVEPLDVATNQSIGRFELIRELARGGMGQVFLARDTRLGRRVAIKFLLQDDLELVQRFLIEAQATARCTHENIVTIFEVGEHRNLPYLVLEYLEGQTLSQVMEGNPSPRQFIELMVPVALALERAHEHGIVHRDLKPSNIFVTERGVVKVLDFGVARLFNETATAAKAAARPAADRLTTDAAGTPTPTSGNYVGTLPYMSPEQWGAAEVDHTTDLWPFGIMLWRALVGAHPSSATTALELQRELLQLDTPLPSIATRDANLPPGLVAIVDRCLAKKKAERYPSARALLDDLQHYLSPARERGGEEECPYKGLASFGEADAKYFFGRSNDIRSALAQLQQWPLLAVVGPSGVGKSSFVKAGLVPALRAAGGPMRVSVLRPGKEPGQRLASVLRDELTTAEVDPHLASRLAESPGLFGSTLRRAAAARGEQQLVVVDQFEELFTLCESEGHREQFLAALLSAADDASAPVRVVLSMRADFLDRLAGHRRFVADLTRGLFFLAAPDQDNLRETIVRPAELAGYTFESHQLVDEMLQTTTSRGALPLLSFAATRLWDGRDSDKKLLTQKAYQQMGGVGGAFAQHADQVVSAIPPQQQQLLKAIMTRLVTPEGTRAVLTRQELLALSAQSGAVEQVLDQLLRGRLIVLQADSEQAVTVELVHEMLISQWPTLQRWLEDSQATRLFVRDLREASRQWQARGRPDDLVWRGATAQEALAHDGRQLLAVAGVEREFLQAVARQVRRTRRARRVALAAIGAALALVLSGGAVAVVRINAARHEAERQRESAQATTGFMVDLFKVSDPSESLGNRITAREILDKGASRIERDLAQQPETQATLMDTIGTVYSGLGLYDSAIPLLDQAVTRRKALFGAVDEQTATALEHRGWALTLRGRLDEAEADVRQAVASHRARGPGARAELARALTVLVEGLGRAGRPEEAEPVIREALAIRRELYGERHLDVAESLEDLALNLDERGDSRAALVPMQQAVDLRRQLQGPAHPLLAGAIGNLAYIYDSLGDFEKAEAFYREALAMQRAVHDGPHPEVATNLNSLGGVLEARGRYDEAEQLYREALTMQRTLLGPSAEVSLVLTNLAFIQHRAGRYQQALELQREALAMTEGLVGPEHPRMAGAVADLGQLLFLQHRLAEAAPLIDRSLELRQKLFGPEHIAVAASLSLQANVLLGTGRYDEALRSAHAAKDIARKSLPATHWKVAYAASAEGAALTSLKRYPEAEPLLLESQPHLRECPIPGAFEQSTQRLVELYKAWGKPEKARQFEARGE